jgi:hypothetical protein
MPRRSKQFPKKFKFGFKNPPKKQQILQPKTAKTKVTAKKRRIKVSSQKVQRGNVTSQTAKLLKLFLSVTATPVSCDKTNNFSIFLLSVKSEIFFYTFECHNCPYLEVLN